MPESRRSSEETDSGGRPGELLDAGGEIEADGLRVRGQGIEPLTAQPGGEVPPVGVIGPLGVFGAGVAGVVARLFGERREMGGGRPLDERRAVTVRVVVLGHLVLVLARGRRGRKNPTPRRRSDGPKRRFAPGNPGVSNHVR